MDLPDLHTAELDPPTFAALFDDLERHAEGLEVRIKGAATANAAEGTVSLREAQELLAGGAVRGVQIRYRYAGAEWTDTLLRSATSIRVVRMKVIPPPIV
ncbi:MAG: hypothetical protein Q8P18_01620 [Pseudomonadota bacterium]|nr:hypothetical protein [Pseudomonadota bacterium]